jgi:murein L,D-transpeptidase YcbB/YkuD
MTFQANDLVDALINNLEGYLPKLNNYCSLALSQELIDHEADKLAAIYTEAEDDPLLNFFITELDHILGERLGLLDARAIENYKNQQAWLREHLEQTLFDQTHRVEIQEILQRQELYHGPLDGIWGERSSQALTQFRKRVQKRLQEQGFYHGEIDGVFGERSVTAVMQFQRSRHLVDDGVAGKKTLSALQLECQL